MNEIQFASDFESAGQELQDLVIETFEVEELTELDVNAALPKLSLCSSTTSGCCCG